MRDRKSIPRYCDASTSSYESTVFSLGVVILDLGFWSYTTVIGVSDDYFEPDETDAESAALEWVPIDEVSQRSQHPAFGSAWPALQQRLKALL
jgi:hypothetical protein